MGVASDKGTEGGTATDKVAGASDGADPGAGRTGTRTNAHIGHGSKGDSGIDDEFGRARQRFVVCAVVLRLSLVPPLREAVSGVTRVIGIGLSL